MPHPVHVQWETVGTLRWRIGSSWAECSLRFRALLISAAPRPADDRGGKGSALLGSFEPLLWRWGQLWAVCLLLHWRDNWQGLGKKGKRGKRGEKEKLAQDGLRCLKIASFWVINVNKKGGGVI